MIRVAAISALIGVGCSMVAPPSEPAVASVASEPVATPPTTDSAPDGPTVEPLPGLDVATVRISPHDGFTYTATTFPTILIADAAAELSSQAQRDWESRCRVRELPSGRLVELDAHYAPPNPGGQDHTHRFEFAPTRELSASWYQFEVDLRGTGRRAQSDIAEVRSGVFVSRFRPDSHPIVRAARVYHRSDTTDELQIELTERVFAADQDFHVRSAGTDVHCTLTTRFVLGGPDYGAEEPPPGVEAPQNVLTLLCPTTLDATLELDIRDTVHSALGEAVRGPDDLLPAHATWEVARAQPQVGDDGVTYRVLATSAPIAAM